ncbi:F-box domain-containing protein [Favolaschia claudopus]|uniref:F-box domain-containing protein n=1 Tax=Favolaschia claudopus TaxID=2862362 RepID=A0AAW0BH09_9AGAR
MLDFLAADRAFLAEKDAEIQELQAQISALERAISLLHAARKPAQERLNSYKYPILTLPNEIIAEIFLQFLPPYPSAPPLLGALSPTRLTHICRRWRDIACKTPELWRAIDMDPMNDDQLPMSLDRTIFLTGLWASRSGHCPLSIRLGAYHDPLSTLAPLIPHRDRWEHLTLRIENTRPLRAIQGAFPLLKSFDIRLGSPISDDVVVTLQNLPLLSTVVLDDFRTPHISLPWSQLTSLTLSWIYIEHCISILRQTTHLVHCTFDLYFHPGTQNDFVELVLPQLETLDVQTDAVSPLYGHFFQCLVAPALQHLRIPEHLLQPNPIESLSSFISRSGCHLDELRVTEAYVSQNAYRNAFSAIPDIKMERAESESESESD